MVIGCAILITSPRDGDLNRKDTPLDGEMGEVLVLPTAARWADEATEDRFFNVVGDLVDMYYSGQSFEDVREAAQDLI